MVASETCFGHIDRPQFSVGRTDGGWTNRRDLRSTPTRRGENDLRAQADERSMLRTPSPRRATAVDTTSANSFVISEPRCSYPPPTGAFQPVWGRFRPNPSSFPTVAANPFICRLCHKKVSKPVPKSKCRKTLKCAPEGRAIGARLVALDWLAQPLAQFHVWKLPNAIANGKHSFLLFH